jgi:23S rRNA pseudouridine2605 synthase
MRKRLQKILARSGYGSRRTCETLIEEQRVMVNGRIATLGSKADRDKDAITVDGQPIPKPEPSQYIALHKPQGVLSTVKTRDTRSTVRELIQVPGRLYPVGRLDVDSEGLILMTNDGKLTNHLTHPRYEHEKAYRVLVADYPTPEQLSAWRNGVKLKNSEKTLPAEVEVESKTRQGTWLKVILREGKKRQIRRMGDQTDLPVRRIIRVRIASLSLGDLPPGEWRHLTDDEIKTLKTTYE